MEYIKIIKLSKSEVDEAIMDYLATKEITYNVDEIDYKLKDGELINVKVTAR